MEDNLPDEIYLSVIGETTFLCIKDAHMWPINSIQYINMTKGKGEIHVVFAGNQTWTFTGENAIKFRALVNKDKNELEVVKRKMKAQNE
jgi:hypothetical protein